MGRQFEGVLGSRVHDSNGTRARPMLEGVVVWGGGGGGGAPKMAQRHLFFSEFPFQKFR